MALHPGLIVREGDLEGSGAAVLLQHRKNQGAVAVPGHGTRAEAADKRPPFQQGSGEIGQGVEPRTSFMRAGVSCGKVRGNRQYGWLAHRTKPTCSALPLARRRQASGE